MGKPELKFEDGKLKIKMEAGLDGDKDGKMAVMGSIMLDIDPVEAVTEIAKKDLPWLQALVAQLGMK